MTTEELNKRQHQKTGQLKQARLNIVSEYYKKGYSLRKIADKVMQELGLVTVTAGTSADKPILSFPEQVVKTRLEESTILQQLKVGE